MRVIKWINRDLHVEPLLFQTHEEEITWAFLFAYNGGYDYAVDVTHWQSLPEKPNGK